ncbi:MAG: hypothetical protein KKE02_00025 [Alphaproteobacteria bacterium]|nr:hypothetical protein [Alphaproteobacteria bacterium]MBU1514831.1 hypothetical protein [Alphaproteobacteria bacterium]MBU2093752.1 hypothetical protein [Alphaproteobacteria bacterium]MBU2149373.1 hypothetical protein [Alphaproteobacteria bacterium]MBU2305333.1 hypothetical protein [Alphaproteobacteria bacterium]
MSPTEPDLPKDPAQYRPKPLMGIGFWALIAFGILCVLAGAGVAMFGARLLPTKPAPAVTAVERQSLAAPPPETLPIVVASPTADEVARLNARIATLENQGARTTEAAAAALAAAQLVDASQGSKPFGRELAILRAAAPGLPELGRLARLAETGAPSRTALAASFPPYAAKAVRRARKPPAGDAELGQRIAYVAAKVVTIRRVDETVGTSPDAIVARAELALQEGQVVPALRALDSLPPKAREALAPWRAEAERRAEIDREVTALRARAVRALQAPGPAA